jgi:TRAP-type transport system periplasmic protein
MKKRALMKLAMAGIALAGSVAWGVAGASAQEVTLRLHQFLPEQANVPAYVLKPWIEQVQEASDGRIQIEMYSAMALGGTPPQLIDQARDGVVDIVWTLPGSTPGRFPQAEVFELPFLSSDAEATSRAYWQLFEESMADTDFQGIKILGTWVHGPGLVHVRSGGVRSLDDMSGLKLRAPTRMITQLLEQMGAAPIGMPVPQIPESLSRGVIDGAVVPWEVTPSLRLAELVEAHTEFAGDQAFYVATFVLAMNQAKYDSLPDDLRQILDENTGLEFSAMAGRVMQEYDAPARAVAEEQGNEIITLDEAEVERWVEAAQPVYENWIAEMDGRGFDGQAIVDRARELIDENMQ